MAKYIEADRLEYDITNLLAQNNRLIDDWLTYCIVSVIDEQPAADVQEIRRGRWVDVEPAPHNLFYATCSVCGDRQTIEVANYCPNCGASLRGEEK